MFYHKRKRMVVAKKIDLENKTNTTWLLLKVVTHQSSNPARPGLTLELVVSFLQSWFG